MEAIPINSKLTNEIWLIEMGFQKLKAPENVFWFKKGELYIQYFKNILGKETWHRITPLSNGTTYYAGSPDLGYDCSRTHQVEAHYLYIHGIALTKSI